MSGALNQQLLRLSALLQLEQRARSLPPRELEFLIVNETVGVLPYRQAALWTPKRLVLSGVADADPSAPYRDWMSRLIDSVRRGGQAKSAHTIAATEVPARGAAAWAEWFPLNAIWCPLIGRDQQLLGVLLLGRAEPWTEGDAQVLSVIIGCYTQCLALADMPSRRRLSLAWGARPAVLAGLAGLAIALCLALPVRQSAIAPAEVISIDPAPVRAPFEAVVDKILVAPNALVHAGDPLVTLDRTQLLARRDVAEKTLEMARAEFEVSSQQAMNDLNAKARLALLSGKVEQTEAELAYAKGLLARAELTAPIDGLAVFDGTSEWIGKPVALGERIMQIASPTRVELEIEVPANDAITFETGSEVLFFSNVDPDRPSAAQLYFASYASAMTAEGIMAYRFRARFDAAAAPRLGLRGSAKIYGPKRSLAAWLLRRPIATIRQWLAL
jgi:hypothetical protein